jgi:Tol biopolymer transport system component
MRPAAIVMLALPVTLAPFAACERAADQRVLGIQAMSFANSEWSEPVNLGPVVNSSAGDQNAALSKDGLSLYFSSNRLGTLDIWVSRRDCTDADDAACAWHTPVILGPVINGPSADFAPNLSIDGHLLFFSSVRPDGFGGADIYVSHRADPNDDFGWQPAVNLGPDVNTATGENAPMYLQSAEDGAANLYFNRGVNALQTSDIYVAAVTREGVTLGPAEPVSELNVSGANDAAVTVRVDGRELMFWSTRAGGLGGADLWRSTRQTVHDPWSPPVNLGVPLNTTSDDVTPTLSYDGRTLIFGSNRPGGSGGNDLWMSTRTPSGKEEP